MSLGAVVLTIASIVTGAMLCKVTTQYIKTQELERRSSGVGTC